ncbi:MAG: ATP-dependent Clp protease adaptor ClpS [Methylotenera sp.]|nr:ATP-dependent Clp protease adaptor ClpS [Oligoflexia bacterium]
MALSFLHNCAKDQDARAEVEFTSTQCEFVFATAGGPGDFPDSDEGSETGIAVEEVRNPELKEPRKYAVLLHNDDYTTMEFVIDVLKRFFRKTEQEAMEITMRVHHAGSGLAGIYSYDIAETKVSQVIEYARDNGHPLKSTMEPAD